MGSKIASVTMENVRNYFRGIDWKVTFLSDRTIEVQSKFYDISLHSKGFQYKVKVSAVEDPSDRQSGVTDDPAKYIMEFLGAGLDAVKKHMSSGPERFAAELRLLADAIESGSMTCGGAIRRAFVAASVTARDSAEEDLDDLMVAMKKQGWKVKQSAVAGDPVIEVDISGVYTATVRPHMVWEYSFMVRGVEGSKKSGETEDPIQQFRLFYKDPATQEAKKEVPREQAKAPNEDATAKPGKPKRNDAPTARPTRPKTN